MSATVGKPKKKKSKGRGAPKGPPRQVVKGADDLDGSRPLSRDDYQFCQKFVETQKQVDAFRFISPDAKDPHRGAFRMMQRPEIREHIRRIYREIAKANEHAARVSARSSLLTLELADDRLVEMLQQPRKTRGEMLSKDTKQLLVPGATMVVDDDGNSNGYKLSPEAQASMGEGAPIEDRDLAKAIKLVYERRQGIIKSDKPAEAPPIVRALYRPAWLGKGRAALPQTIEAQP